MFSKRPISYIVMAALVGVVSMPILPAFAVAPYEVTTYDATNICQGGGTLNGYVNPFFTIDTTRWFEWGTSRDNLPYTTNVTRNGRNTEYFQQDLFNLAPNTTYYFRVVAQNSKGLARGETLSFRSGGAPCPGAATVPVFNTTSPVPGTTGTVPSYTPTQSVSQSVITKPTTDITDTTAKLNAVALPIGSVQTFGWFEWGMTPDLGRTTTRKSLGTGTSILWGEGLSGLTPGTTYFLKPVIENQNGISEGALFSFRTTGVAPAGATPVVNTPTAAVKKPSVVKTTKPLVIADKKEPKTVIVSVVPETDTVAPGGRIKETVQFTNTTGATMKEAAVRVVIPCDAKYISDGSDNFTQTGTLLTKQVGDVKPKETVKLTVWLETSGTITDENSFKTVAVVNWDDKLHPEYTQSSGMAVVYADTDKVAQGSVAAAGANKSANSFFPKSLYDWGAVIGFFFLLIAAYMVFLITRKNDSADNGELLETVPVFNNPQQREVSAGIGLNPAVGVPYRKYTSNDPFVSEKNRQAKAMLPVVPMKKTTTEKSAPPDNLPI